MIGAIVTGRRRPPQLGENRLRGRHPVSEELVLVRGTGDAWMHDWIVGGDV